MTKIEIFLAVAFATYAVLSGLAIFVLRCIIIRQKEKMRYYKSAKYQRELLNKRATEIHKKNNVKGMTA
ncbi:hypothetical protein [Streptococcus sp. 400_SSPC]|uniref:hypothetical protein n=1 Tax=Streptococcus sp. 400_SSPC TaxID=1579341 RepID=UPI000660B428|nr:hypothetical protein [Streptococcus sp. 400_SSPC]